MATLLDTGLADLFSFVLTFLLVYTVVYGVLSWRKWMGNQPGTYAIIAFSIAFMMTISPPARAFLQLVTPWYIALAMVIFFILFIASMFGLSADKDFPNIIKDSRARNWIMIFSVLILLAGLAFTFGQTLLSGQPGGQQPTQPPPGTVIGGDGSAPIGVGEPTNSQDFSSNLINTMIHPKVLGMILILLIASFSIYFLSSEK
ncbi:hypothetical protein GOV11_01405 [Candidatus Woesearchaeota archaeon]|nr:hypothetical protein [Candidatus Woesearchaeota archaeon]